VIELHFFGGLKQKEIAEVLDISHGAVKRDMTLAKLWLLGELGGGQDDDS
jgi:DNA-directed RNA polymerase specialized sigma24 family protein